MSFRPSTASLLIPVACWTLLFSTASAEEPLKQAQRHLAGGEFIAAKQLADALPDTSRNAMLAQIARGQAATGSVRAAAESSSAIDSATDAGPAFTASFRQEAAGGGAIADFESLMELIQTTIVPDTWEELGGPSTMSPYPAGVFVDAQGLIQDVQRSADADQLAQLRIESFRQVGAAAADWRQASALRKVSLNRLQRELARRQFGGMPLGMTMRNLAGLSTIQYVFISEAGDDVILAGSVGGIRLDAYRQPVDSQTGRAALSLDSLTVALRSVGQKQPFGCTIEPTADGIVRTQQVTAELQAGKLPAAAAGPKLKTALGLQDIRLFGTADDTSTALLMVEADRHMKMLALGTQPMPRGVANYLDIVEATIDQGPLTGSFLRMWFAPQPIKLRCDVDQRSFELSGLPLQLLSEQEAADHLGRRFAVDADLRARRFAETFNRHFVDIALRHTIYDRLRGLYELTAVAQLIDTYLPSDRRGTVIGRLAEPDLWGQAVGVAPRQTESLVVHRRFRQGKTVHSVVVASGGVQIDPAAMLSGQPTVYTSLSSVAAEQSRLPRRTDHWWWD